MNEERAGGFGTFWLIVRDEGEDGGVRRRVFTQGADGDPKTLPVFSFEEEALLFSGLGGLEGLWSASRFAATGLVTVLTGPCRGARRVVIDPFPEVGLRGYLGAMSLGREEFVDLLVFGRGFRTRTTCGPSAPEGRASVPPGTPSERTSSDR